MSANNVSLSPNYEYYRKIARRFFPQHDYGVIEIEVAFKNILYRYLSQNPESFIYNSKTDKFSNYEPDVTYLFNEDSRDDLLQIIADAQHIEWYSLVPLKENRHDTDFGRAVSFSQFVKDVEMEI